MVSPGAEPIGALFLAETVANHRILIVAGVVSEASGATLAGTTLERIGRNPVSGDVEIGSPPKSVGVSFPAGIR